MRTTAANPPSLAEGLLCHQQRPFVKVSGLLPGWGDCGLPKTILKHQRQSVDLTSQSSCALPDRRAGLQANLPQLESRRFTA